MLVCGTNYHATWRLHLPCESSAIDWRPVFSAFLPRLFIVPVMWRRHNRTSHSFSLRYFLTVGQRKHAIRSLIWEMRWSIFRPLSLLTYEKCFYSNITVWSEFKLAGPEAGWIFYHVQDCYSHVQGIQCWISVIPFFIPPLRPLRSIHLERTATSLTIYHWNSF